MVIYLNNRGFTFGKSHKINCSKIFFTKIKNNIKIILSPKYKKAHLLKNLLIKLFKDYEETTGINEVPYLEKAELMMDKILKENKVDYYYDRLKKAEKLD